MPTETAAARAQFYLRLLYWALLEIRLSGWDEKGERCASIADAFHHLPEIIAALVQEQGVADQEEAFLRDLTRQAELDGWGQELQAWQHYASGKEAPPKSAD